MPSKPVQIGDRFYPSQAAALRFIREVRKPYIDPTGRRRLRVTDSSHHEFLVDMLLLHTESADKIGVGVDHFRVGPDEEFGTDYCFYVYRSDGTSTDFSFHNCVSGGSERADRLSALREAIEPQKTQFKVAAFAGRRIVPCAELGTDTTVRSAHVDHEAPRTFQALVEAWLAARGLSLMDIAVTPSSDNQFVTRMTDRNQQEEWSAYHLEHARLRILCRTANLSTTRRSRS